MITSIDKSLAQQIANTVKDVCGQNINFIDRTGIIFASTDAARIGAFHEIGLRAASTGQVIEAVADNIYEGTQKGINLPIYYNHTLLAVIGITGEPDEVRKYAHLAERITNLLIKEREVNAFSKNQADRRHYAVTSLLKPENVNQDHLRDCLKEFGIHTETDKRLILIRINPGCSLGNLSLLDQKILQMFSSISLQLYTFQYPSEYVAVADDAACQASISVIRKFASDHHGLLKAAIGKKCRLLRLSASYNSAVTAWKSISESSEDFVLFDDLTMEIILSSLDKHIAEEFIQKTISALTEEDRTLLSVYFDENMSLAAACSRLFLHKNTMQYKLNRIWQRCGFNPRHFQDAVLLYLALKMQ